MKNRIYGIFYLVIIAFYLLRPVLPYVDYSLNKNYIAKYLCVKKDLPGNCCQGKCYLSKQLQKNSVPDDTDKESGKQNFQDKRLEDHFKSEALILTPAESDFVQLIFYKTNNSESFLLPAFVPPKYL
jgi:hypothetical protein